MDARVNPEERERDRERGRSAKEFNGVKEIDRERDGQTDIEHRYIDACVRDTMRRIGLC